MKRDFFNMGLTALPFCKMLKNCNIGTARHPIYCTLINSSFCLIYTIQNETSLWVHKREPHPSTNFEFLGRKYRNGDALGPVELIE